MRIFAVWFLLAAAVSSYAGETVTVNAVGDVMIGTLFPEKRIPPENGAAIFKFAAPYLTNGQGDVPADIVMGNLEGAITDYPHTVKRIRPGYTYAFRMPPANTRHIREAGFTVMTTANNHALDFDWKGYRDTRKILATNGIRSVGDKREVLSLDIRGVRVAVIAFGWFERGNSILAHEPSMRFIRETADSNDIVIVSLHGGAEGEKALHVRDAMETYLGEKRGNLVKFCRGAVDNGADLVIGHGPHVPRAMELYRGRLIAYSLGNFATYGMATQGYKKYTLVLRALLNDRGEFLSGSVVPMMQHEGGAWSGIPYFDPEGRTSDLIDRLSGEDFPGTGIGIGPDGGIRERRVQ